MAINLEKYKDSLISAWKDVVDEKSSTDWALFSYEGQSNDLKVIGKGDGGIEEMREELNIGKVMYAFCKVFDPKTSLFKFILINWQGEGAPHHRKASSANHIRDVSCLLKGFHVTLNARNEEEVNSDIIIEKLSKASAYSFKARGETVPESGPVGTTYKRVIPAQEINSNERDKFWQKEEQEEKQRQEAEKKRKEEERKKLDLEIKQRESEQEVQREAKIKERSRSIAVLRDKERNEMLERMNSAKQADKNHEADLRKEEIEKVDRSEVIRKQRSEETQALISKRTINARAVFEQYTSAGQLLQRRASHQQTSGVREQRAKLPPSQQANMHMESDVNNISKASENVEERTFPPRVEAVNQDRIQHTNKTQEKQSPVINSHSVIQDTINQKNDLAREQPSMVDEYVNNEKLLQDYEDLDLKAQALYDYQAADETEISFDPGDIITRIDQIDAGWWQGMAPDGRYGLFPANYVQLLTD